MPNIDERVVQMTFDNKQFEKNVSQSIKSLDDLKKALDDSHLRCIGSHISMADLLGSRFEIVAEYNKVIGNRNLIVAGGLANPLENTGGNRFTAYLFSRLAQKAEDHGQRTRTPCLSSPLIRSTLPRPTD